jgi:hypothetical protein
MVVARMQAHGRERDVVHLNVPEAGHVLFPFDPGAPPPPLPFDLGGSPGAQQAHAIAWPQTVRTLRRA